MCLCPGFDRGGPGTCACALRRKMYDPQGVEGTPPSGLRLGIKLLPFCVAFCVQVPGAHFAIMRREACQRECPRAGCLAEYMASRSSFRGGCLAKTFASRKAFDCLQGACLEGVASHSLLPRGGYLSQLASYLKAPTLRQPPQGNLLKTASSRQPPKRQTP